MAYDLEGLHIFPHEDHFLIFNTRNEAVVRLNQSGLAILKQIADEPMKARQYENFLHRLRRCGIDVSNATLRKSSSDVEAGEIHEFAPTSVTLFPSHNCNLRCLYCYSNASAGTAVMSWEVAASAIRFGQCNAANSKERSGGLNFHGGGEPFFGESWKLLRRSVEYANREASALGIKWSISGSTNGVLSASQLKWIVDNEMKVQVSFDGPKSIQDVNRPIANGSGSFKHALRTIEFFEQAGHPYSIRATVTDESIGRLPEIIEFFSSVSSVGLLHLEPVSECGRCESTNVRGPNSLDFSELFAEAELFAADRGWTLYCSQCHTENRARFCGALTPNFCVTPEGYVSSCYEVVRATDVRSNVFFYGKFEPTATRQFVFDRDRMAFLRGRTAERLAGCKSCVAQHTCAGDCPARAPGNIYDTSSEHERCRAIRSYLVKRIIETGEPLAAHSDPAIDMSDTRSSMAIRHAKKI